MLSQYIALHCNHRFTFDFQQNYNKYTYFWKRPKPSNHGFNNFIIFKKNGLRDYFCPTLGFRTKVYKKFRNPWAPYDGHTDLLFENLAHKRTDGYDH